MFARVKKPGKFQYLKIVENRKEKGKVKQRVIASVGRLDRLQEKRNVENLVRSLFRFSENDSGFFFERNDIKQDLSFLQEIVIEEKGKQLAVRTQCAGICGKVFKPLGIAVPSTIREV